MIFYIDTSTSYLYSCLYDDDKIIDKLVVNLERNLSKDTLSLVNDMFKRNNKTFRDTKKIIAVTGPGSFTGIRVGLTIAKTIGWSLNIPIIPISSLTAMAYSSEETNSFFAPIIDARRGHVYGSIYDPFNNSFIMNEQYVSLDALIASLESLPGDFSFITNDDIKLDFRVNKYVPNFKNIIDKVKDNDAIDAHLLDANYLKKTEAEEKRNDC